jgi:acetyl esterase/lipase
MDLGAAIDPEVQELLAASPIGGVDFGSLELSDLPRLRETMATMPRPPVPATSTVHRDEVVPGPDGAPDVTVRVFRDGRDGRAEKAGPPAPCLYWIHGGGYMFGSALMADARIDRWVEQLGCTVVSVEYRLAPEHPYPAPLEDCYAGLVWTWRQAQRLGVDPARILIGGASAGGGLAAALALLARDRGEVPVTYQLLIYPMIDDRNVTVSSNFAAPVWNRDANRLGWRAYLGADRDGDDVPAYAAPARATDLAGLPPAFIAVGTADVFRDEDIDYSRRLLEAGVPTELHVYPGAPHGFEMLAAGAGVARRCQADIDGALGRALHPAAAGQPAS